MEPLFIAVLALSAISVSRAEESLFVRKGGSVRLDVQRHEQLQFNSLYWNLNISTTVLVYIHKIKAPTLYKNSTEFDKNNFSLLLKNVQERDSGNYTATITNKEGQKICVASYRLIVQEAPPTPQVRVALLSSAEGFCNVSVNCSAKDTWASYTCDHAHCTQVENTTSPTGVNITVTVKYEDIYCNSSNWVDTKTQSESTKDVCPPNSKNESSPNTTNKSLVGGIVAAIISFIIFIIIIVYVIYKKRRKCGGSQIQEMSNNVYSSTEGLGVELSNTSTVGTMYDTVPTATPEHHPKVKTVYDMLGPAGDPQIKPESLYATVKKGAS